MYFLGTLLVEWRFNKWQFFVKSFECLNVTVLHPVLPWLRHVHVLQSTWIKPFFGQSEKSDFYLSPKNENSCSIVKWLQKEIFLKLLKTINGQKALSKINLPSQAAETSAHPLSSIDTANHSVLLQQAIIVCYRGTHNSCRKQPAPFRSGKGAVAGRAACLMFEAVKNLYL